MTTSALASRTARQPQLAAPGLSQAVQRGQTKWDQRLESPGAELAARGFLGIHRFVGEGSLFPLEGDVSASLKSCRPVGTCLFSISLGLASESYVGAPGPVHAHTFVFSLFFSFVLGRMVWLPSHPLSIVICFLAEVENGVCRWSGGAPVAPGLALETGEGRFQRRPEWLTKLRSTRT